MSYREPARRGREKMPLFDRDRYQRLDGGGGGGRRSPSSCSTATIALFVALCLVGAWMMASTGNVPMTVSPENKSAEAKEEDASSIDVTDVVKGGGGGGNGDGTPQATEEAADDVGKKDQDAGDATKTTDDVGYTGVKDDGDGAATQTTTDASRSDAAAVVAETDAVANTTTGGTEAGESGKPAGETTAPKNQTFSDENGKTEGGEVVKPEDPDKQSADDAPTDGKDTGGQASSDADEAPSTDTKENASQADKDTDQSTEEEPTDTNGAGYQAVQNADETSTETKANKSSDNAPADAKATGDGGTPLKNQTSFDDENGKMDGVEPVTEDGKVSEKSSEQASTNGDDGGGVVQTTDDDTTAGASSNNQTISDQNEESKTMTTTFAAVDGSNGTISQTTEDDSAANSTAATEEIKPAAEQELLPSGQLELLNETASAVAQNGSFPTQASESSAQKKARESNGSETTAAAAAEAHEWKLCNVTVGADYIPCLDNEAAIKKLKSTKHYEHRERHCPAAAPTCLVPLPDGYRRPIPWPYSRDKIWYHNVPHTNLASYKGHQNWVKVSGEHVAFPGGGTQFKNGAAHYIDLIEEALPAVAWGRRSRVVLDVGCGVASFGGFLFDRDALTMSLAPKDEHEAQVQFALERGIPAISAVMGTKRLPFPGGAYDAVHCARCRVPWHIEGGKLLLEVNRLLRPGGLFVWSATPVYQKTPEDVQIWHDMAALTKSMCWEMVKKTNDTVDETAMVIFKKPTSNGCYSNRKQPEPPLCDSSDDQNAAWNITLRACMHSLPTNTSARGARWPEQWPERLSKAPYWLSPSQVGVYGKPAPDDLAADNEHWSHVVNSSYLAGVGIDWSNVRNVMDMRAVYGGSQGFKAKAKPKIHWVDSGYIFGHGNPLRRTVEIRFAAALKDMNVWVMNVVPMDSADTLPIIYERGLFGMYHDWCESFSTYPRSYNLLHADHLFCKLKNRCKLLPVMVEVDRILRPEGKLIVRDDHDTAAEVESILRSLHWEVRMTVSKQGEVMLCAEKTMWRPTEVEVVTMAS